MKIKQFLMAFSLLCGYTVASAQIMLSPVFYSTIDGLNEDNGSILEGRLQSLISSMDMVSSYGGRFVLFKPARFLRIALETASTAWS